MTRTAPPNPDPKFLLTEHQLAELRGLTVGWLRDDRRGPRRIPYVALGKAIRYRLDVADAAIDKLFKGNTK